MSCHTGTARRGATRRLAAALALVAAPIGAGWRTATVRPLIGDGRRGPRGVHTSSRLATTPRPTARRLLATAALAAVVGLGVSMSTPAGSASAAPAAHTSSSIAGAGSITASKARKPGYVNRSFFVTPHDLAQLSFGQTDPTKLAAGICTGNHTGMSCVTTVANVLRGEKDIVDWRTCNITGGYTIVFPDAFQSHCG